MSHDTQVYELGGATFIINCRIETTQMLHLLDSPKQILFGGHSYGYFGVTFQCEGSLTNRRQIIEALEHIWAQLYSRKVVIEPSLPKLTAGQPRLMSLGQDVELKQTPGGDVWFEKMRIGRIPEAESTD